MATQPLRISKEEFVEMVRRGGGFVLVDAREPEAYEGARLKPQDSVHIPPATPPDQYPRLPRDRLILTV
ncbi:MAG: hypothetical protein HY331_09265 [Chloroflexi bacterium]|nr:hypothetical protein [Chloroflexota bacterium]